MGLFAAHCRIWASILRCKQRRRISLGQRSKSRPSRLGREVRQYAIRFSGPGCSIKWPGADDCPRGPSILRPAGLAKRDYQGVVEIPSIEGLDLQLRKSQLREICRDGYDTSAHALIFAIVRANDIKLSPRINPVMSFIVHNLMISRLKPIFPG